ncbi:ORF6N domain-containing protein [Ruegeria sp. HKCCD6228]|uniref:ORF6N domain-containing protein n=1 Tax=unclassified Ruegeria TaxID=2625375 RepID=UPI00148992B3|nr:MULTISPECIES: ORF6N domain-containing protein [unclassified Ruegeria]NOD97260.1 ORF6N domain-containing protein [Ruegeria sp. HKCCD6228]
MTNPNTLPSTHEVQSAIHRVRGIRVVLAEDLAQFYGKSVSAFNQAVSRNTDLFEGYRFQLTDAEVGDLQSQNVISKPKGRGGRRVNPWVYTDYGVAIASTLFKDPRAIKITRMITEAFVDGANAVTETPRSAPEILPPEGTPAPLLPNGDQLRALAENILDSGQQSLVDYIANPTTKRQQAVAVIMKTLAETAGEEVRTQQERLRLSIAERLAAGDYADDDDRKGLLELLNAMKG